MKPRSWIIALLFASLATVLRGVMYQTPPATIKYASNGSTQDCATHGNTDADPCKPSTFWTYLESNPSKAPNSYLMLLDGTYTGADYMIVAPNKTSLASMSAGSTSLTITTPGNFSNGNKIRGTLGEYPEGTTVSCGGSCTSPITTSLPPQPSPERSAIATATSGNTSLPVDHPERFYWHAQIRGTNGEIPADTYVLCEDQWPCTSPLTLSAAPTVSGRVQVYDPAITVYNPDLTVRGSAGAPIHVFAKNDGGVFINGENTRAPVWVGRANDYFYLKGFDVANAPASAGGVLQANGNHGLYQRLVVYDADTTNNVHTWASNGMTYQGRNGASYNTLEDVGIFGVGRYSWIYFTATGATLRRVWIKHEGSKAYNGPHSGLCTAYHSNGLRIEDLIVRNDASALSSDYWMYTSADYTDATYAVAPNNRYAGPSTSEGPCEIFPPGTPPDSTPADGTGPVYCPAYFESSYDSGTFIGLGSGTPDKMHSGFVALDGALILADVPTDKISLKYGLYTESAIQAVHDLFIYAPSAQKLVARNTPYGPTNFVGFSVASYFASQLGNLYDVTTIAPASDTCDTEYTVTDAIGGSATGATCEDKVAHGTTLTATMNGGSLYTGVVTDGGHPNRGARLRYRHYNGVLQDGTGGTRAQPLWPWPMNARIKAATTRAHTDSHAHAIEDPDALRIRIFGKSPDE